MQNFLDLVLFSEAPKGCLSIVLLQSGLPHYFCCVVWALGPWLTERDSQGNVIISIGVDNQYSLYLHCKKKMLHSSGNQCPYQCDMLLLLMQVLFCSVFSSIED